MMLNEQEINGVKWLDGVSLPDFELIKNLEKYKIHELDLKACLK